MVVLLILLSVFAAGIPMVGFLVVMVLMDRYDREPWWLVGLTFAWGAVGAVGIAVVASLVVGLPVTALLGSEVGELAGTVLIAPLVEEPAKALVLLPLAFSRHFDNATDGFVYGAAAGLGFGMSENFLYFASAASGSTAVWVMTVVIRTLFTAMMHACATSMVGAAVGWAKHRSLSWKISLVPVGLLLAMGMHALWNGPLAFAGTVDAGGVLAAAAYMLFPLEFLLLFGVYQCCLWGESKMIRAQLAEEARAGTLPAEHVHALGSWSARLRPGGWLDPSVDAREYIRCATRIAFRRHQHALVPSDARCGEELQVLRAQLRRVLAGSAAVEPDSG